MYYKVNIDMITFICCYNNQKELDEMLLSSYKKMIKDAFDCNLLLIDTKTKGYKSAAEAYNVEIKNNYNDLGDIFIFLHQDIAFDRFVFINTIRSVLENNPNTIIGFAGMATDRRVYSNLQYFKSKNFIVRNQIDGIKEVESVDECCFAMTKDLWNRVRFDEKVCYHWHLYAVDFCLTAKSLCNSKVVVLSDVIYHKQDGGGGGMFTDKYFLETMWCLIRKHIKNYSVILAPCYIVETNVFRGGLKLLRTYIKNCFVK